MEGALDQAAQVELEAELCHLRGVEDHVLTIIPVNPGLAAYDFTFG